MVVQHISSSKLFNMECTNTITCQICGKLFSISNNMKTQKYILECLQCLNSDNLIINEKEFTNMTGDTINLPINTAVKVTGSETPLNLNNNLKLTYKTCYVCSKSSKLMGKGSGFVPLAPVESQTTTKIL